MSLRINKFDISFQPRSALAEWAELLDFADLCFFTACIRYNLLVNIKCDSNYVRNQSTSNALGLA